jgi:16S rRNA (guanine527-N7)-methyltransferase
MKKEIEKIIKDREKQEKIYNYFLLLKEWSEKINLISRRDIENNFLNLLNISVFTFEKTKKYKKIVDFGSGAGFPSIPGKILDKERELVLVEPGKRAEFLNAVKEKLSLKNVEIEKKDFNGFFKKKRENLFDIGISWGIRDKISLLKTGRNFVSIGYVFITGPNEIKKMRGNILDYKITAEKIEGKALLSLVFARKFHVEH